MSTSPEVHDLVLTGGRVIDPLAGVDTVTDIAVSRGVVAAIGPGLLGRTVLNATGCVVAPGFVDLHSHAQSLDGHRLQAMDGVTTSLDLESGVAPAATAYADAEQEGRPLNFGFSAPWAAVRMQVLAGWEPNAQIGSMLSHIGDPAWQRPATAAEVDRIVAGLETELAAGALGIGVIIGYAQATDPAEYLAVARLAASRGVPTYTHARDLIEITPDVVVDGAEEIVRAAGETGAAMHYCHVNSTSLRHVDRVVSLVDKVRAAGSTVTTEAYPYGAGMTGIGAQFLAPELLAARGLTPQSLVYAPTGERVADAGRLTQLRSQDPGGLVIVEFFDESKPADLEILMRSFALENTCIASDAMPLTWHGTPTPDVWPLPPTAFGHPRTAGTFARSYRRAVLEQGLFDVTEFVRRASALPAQVVQTATGGAVRKGTLAVGADADVVVFDAEVFRDQATYTESTRPSAGVRHLVVVGTPVVRDGMLDLAARPGRPVRAAH